MNPKVDWYFDKAQKWQKEITLLRSVVLDCGLAETLKWGCPCYIHLTGSGRTIQENNVVLIHVFKEYCALLFFKGALLQDVESLLTQQTANVQSARQMRFTSLAEIQELMATIKAYIYEAIEIENAGLKVELKPTTKFPMPEEFKNKLDTLPVLKAAFEGLTPGRQRGYLLYFSQPKQSKTRISRIEKYIPAIMDGKGLND